MRITTQMLNQSARKAGLPINNTSLLSYIKNNRIGNSFQDALTKKTKVSENLAKKSDYKKLETIANQLINSAGILLQEDEKSLFQEEIASGDKQKVYDSIQSFVENYNNTLKKLRTIPNTMNTFYRQMLLEISAEEKENLSTIGITFAKEGTASVNIKKLKTADMKTLEGIFGKDSEFVNRVKFLSERIADNAKANMKSLNSTYHADGSMYSTRNSSMYDFWR